RQLGISTLTSPVRKGNRTTATRVRIALQKKEGTSRQVISYCLPIGLVADSDPCYGHPIEAIQKGGKKKHGRESRRLAGNAGADGAENAGFDGAAARVWDCAAHRTDQR